MENRGITIRFLPEFGNVDVARAAVGGACVAAFSGRQAAGRTDEFLLAVTEAMNNAVEHSGARLVEIDLLMSPEAVTFRMHTEGDMFDPTKGASMPGMDGDDAPEGGFGMALMKELVDRMDYEYKDGRNTLTLEKRF